jgi:hypothetical protein
LVCSFRQEDKLNNQKFRTVVCATAGEASRLEKSGTAAAFEVLARATPGSPVHTSGVTVHQRVFEYQRTDGLKPVAGLTR